MQQRGARQYVLGEWAPASATKFEQKNLMNLNTISSASFELRRADILQIMLEQCEASAKIVDEKTGLWRKIRLISLILIPVFVLAGTINRPSSQTIQICFALLLVAGAFFKLSSWRIRRAMAQMGVEERVSQKQMVKALDSRVFKGRESLLGKASFDDSGFELMQDGVAFSAGYDDFEKIGLISERHGLLQIAPGDDRHLPDTDFFIPLKSMPNAAAVMERIQKSPSFVFQSA